MTTQQEKFLLRLKYKIKRRAKLIGKEPSFLFMGEKQVGQLEMCEGIFCPGEFVNEFDMEKPFGLEPVFVNRENFLFVG